MPDIDPAALSRPTVALSTPILSTKSINVSAPGSLKTAKTSQIIPPRIDLEPLYTALKHAVGNESWVVYKESTTEFLLGRLNQAEYSERVDPIIFSFNGEREHLHNQLIAAIYGNVTREMPDAGLAPWVSANDKPSSGVGSKPVSGDAAERRLKGDIMQLPTRDRRRIKDLVQNDFDPYENLASAFTEMHRKPAKLADVPASAAGSLSNLNFDLEIRKRFAQPLAIESGEFPDIALIEGRMLPFCYEAGLVSGHAQDAAHFMTIATENFVKEAIMSILSKTRSNGPGETGSAGFGGHANWIQTHKYKRQLAREEDAALHGEITRDKSGMLPIEQKAASERGPLGMADVRIALEMAECGISRFPSLNSSMLLGYREGELETWEDYTWLPGSEEQGGKRTATAPANGGSTGLALDALPNGYHDFMDVDSELCWEGAEPQDAMALDSVLDSCLAVG